MLALMESFVNWIEFLSIGGSLEAIHIHVLTVCRNL